MLFALSKLIWIVLTPSNLCLAGVSLGLALLLLGGKAAAGRLIAWSLALFIVFGLSPLGNVLLLALEERFPPRIEGRTIPHGIIVLGGWTDTQVSASRNVVAVGEASERFFKAIELARRYPQAHVVFSGGDGSFSGDVGNEADDTKRLMDSVGFDDSRVIYERRSRNTAENAVFTRDLVLPQVGETWLLITSAAHMPRAIGSFRAIGFEVEAVPVDYRSRGAIDMWRWNPFFGKGLARFDAVAREWLGLLSYWLIGRSNALFPAP